MVKLIIKVVLSVMLLIVLSACNLTDRISLSALTEIDSLCYIRNARFDPARGDPCPIRPA